MEQIEIFTQTLQDFKKFCISQCKEAFVSNPELLAGDILYISAINRSLDVAESFINATKYQNFSVMPVLLRLQLNTLATLHYLQTHDVTGEVISKFHSGIEFRNITVPGTKNKLTDRLMVEKAALDYPWIKSVYSATSSWVHLSPTLAFTPIEVADGRLITLRLPRLADPKFQYAVDELCEAMTACINGIQEKIEKWARTRI